jgi:hypothetical protein
MQEQSMRFLIMYNGVLLVNWHIINPCVQKTGHLNIKHIGCVHFDFSNGKDVLIVSYLTDKMKHSNIKHVKPYCDINHHLETAKLKEMFSIIKQAT